MDYMAGANHENHKTFAFQNCESCSTFPIAISFSRNVANHNQIYVTSKPGFCIYRQLENLLSFLFTDAEVEFPKILTCNHNI